MVYLVPAPSDTDMIYAVITDELGLFGACALLLTYLMLIARGFKAALLAQDSFSKLMATGLSTILALQVFVIVGGVTRVIPLTGVTLPFVSYGGSSILANFVLVALLLLISDRARQNGRAMNTAILRLFGFCVILFALLVVFTSRWTVFDATALQNNPLNRSQFLAELTVKRGRILADNGQVLARSVKGPGDTWTRTYPTGSLFAQAVGYLIADKGESAGLERSYSGQLRGAPSGLQSIFGSFSSGPQVGNDVYTTLDPTAQRVAVAQLAGPSRLGRRDRPPDGRDQGAVLEPHVR